MIPSEVRRASVILVSVAALLLIGCSGNDGDESAPAETPFAFHTFELTLLEARLVADLRPPVIVESFDEPRCPADPVSTLDLIGCAQRKLLKVDRAINAHAKTIFRRLGSRSARLDFVRSERTWLRYRRTSCKAQASFLSGGSAQPVAYLECMVNRNKSHLAELAEMKYWLRPK